MSVINNPDRHQFEVIDGDHKARLVYRINGDVLDLIHTEVPKEMGGRGVAGELASTALEFAAQNNMLVRPTCPYVRAYLKRHPDTPVKLTERLDD